MAASWETTKGAGLSAGPPRALAWATPQLPHMGINAKTSGGRETEHFSAGALAAGGCRL